MKDPIAGTRVLMLLENAPYSRESRVPHEAAALISAGCQVSVICPGEPDQRWFDVRDQVRVYRFPPPPSGEGLLGYTVEYGFAMMAAFFLSLYLLLREGFDVIHIHCPPDTFVLIAAFYKVLGRKFVYDHHDLAPELYCARFDGTPNRFVFQMLVVFEKLCCKLADHVVTTNESYKTIEMQRGGVPGDRITVVRNGPDLVRLDPSLPAANVCDLGTTCICYVGWMGLQDGVDHLIRALYHLVHDLKRTNFLCVLAGAGSAFPSLNSLSKQLGLTRHVSFLGYVPRDVVACYINAADICVAPEPSSAYNDRSTAIKMMEYMAMGKPIVAFDLPEHRVSAQQAAAYARPNDTLDFACQIVALMDNPEQRFRMGLAGRQRVESELAWSHQARSLLSAYQTMLA